MLSTPSLAVVLEMTLVNLAMSGENAVALAVVLGTLSRVRLGRALVLASLLCVGARLLLALVVTQLIAFPGLRLLGGALLLVIGWRLVTGDDDVTLPRRHSAGLLGAATLIAFTDTITSLDNVLAMTAVADGDISSLALGLALGVPPLLWGASLVAVVLDRYPWLTWFGAALLLWIGTGLAVSDPIVLGWLPALATAGGRVAAWALTLTLLPILIRRGGRARGGTRSAESGRPAA